MLITIHLVLTKQDVRKLCSSESLSKSIPHGFQALLIFGLALVTAMRPSSLTTLSMNQVKLIKRDKDEIWSINGVIGIQITLLGQYKAGQMHFETDLPSFSYGTTALRWNC